MHGRKTLPDQWHHEEVMIVAKTVTRSNKEHPGAETAPGAIDLLPAIAGGRVGVCVPHDQIHAVPYMRGEVMN